MSIVVKDKKTGKRYIYLGAGYGAFQSAVRVNFLGQTSVQEDQGELPMIAVCDQMGEIGWFYSDEVQVETIDGHNPFYYLNRKK